MEELPEKILFTMPPRYRLELTFEDDKQRKKLSKKDKILQRLKNKLKNLSDNRQSYQFIDNKIPLSLIPKTFIEKFDFK